MTAESEFALSNEDFRFIADTVYQQAGILLGDHKRNLVYSRLVRRLRALGLPTFQDYCSLLQSREGSDELGAMINALTTNLTSFFREAHHFDHLKQVALPESLKAEAWHGRRLRIWSSACSTGEEAYSIAMTLCSAPADLSRWDVKVLATDLDTSVLATAIEGLYGQQAVDKIPPAALRFVEPAPDGRFRVVDKVRKMLTFKQLNLLGAWPMRGPFDVIFCRNVMIYFDAATKTKLIDRFVEILRPGGWLYLGHSETLTGSHAGLKLVGRTTYRREM